MKKEICLLNDSFPPIIDGVANAVVNYAKYIPESRFSSIVVTPDCPGSDDSSFPFPVVRYPSIDLRKQLGYTAGIPFDPKTLINLEKREIALIHSHCPIASNVLARGLREGLDVPIVMTYHTKYDIDIADAIRSKTLQTGAVKALVANVNVADEVWCVSHGAGENLRSLGYEGDYLVMPNGVDIPRGRASDDQVLEATKDYDLPGDLPVFLFVGRLKWYKGLRIILDALAALKSQQMDFRMVFIGSGGDEAEVRQVCTELGLDGKVIFTGSIRDREILTAWYTRSDLFLFPSTFDTNGLVVREAAACSLGAVMVGGSCAAEGVTGGVNGLLIEENAASLAVCLARIMENRDKMREIGENASRDLYLSWEDAVARAVERYEIVIDHYQSGKYPKKRLLTEEMATFRGEILNWYERADQRRQEFGELIERYL